MNQQQMWRAVVDRDSRYAGQFVFAVKSTGIYCRPGCPARTPARLNALFFANTMEAQAAGFRACRKCRPDAPQQSTLPLPEPSKRERRLHERMDRFKGLVREGRTVTDAMYEAGFGSSSRLYSTTNERLGMTPQQYQGGGKGVLIRYAIATSAAGRILAGMTERGVCAVYLADSDPKLVQSLQAEYPAARLVEDPDGLQVVLDSIVESLGAGKDAQEIPIDVDGSKFQWTVWNELRRIPRGETRTYTQIAEALGRPTAARAVARACATNKVALLIPCHRVVRGDGSLSGYRWGVPRKRRLLDLEKDLS